MVGRCHFLLGRPIFRCYVSFREGILPFPFHLPFLGIPTLLGSAVSWYGSRLRHVLVTSPEKKIRQRLPQMGLKSRNIYSIFWAPMASFRKWCFFDPFCRLQSFSWMIPFQWSRDLLDVATGIWKKICICWMSYSVAVDGTLLQNWIITVLEARNLPQFLKGIVSPVYWYRQ